MQANANLMLLKVRKQEAAKRTAAAAGQKRSSDPTLPRGGTAVSAVFLRKDTGETPVPPRPALAR